MTHAIALRPAVSVTGGFIEHAIIAVIELTIVSLGLGIAVLLMLLGGVVSIATIVGAALLGAGFGVIERRSGAQRRADMPDSPSRPDGVEDHLRAAA